MIPNNNILNNATDISFVKPKNIDYKMVQGQNVIRGYVEEIEMMKQVVYKILVTERYKYIIYSWNYGIELDDLFGQPTNYVKPELKRRIIEALIQDVRIINVDNFEFDDSKRGVLEAKFTVYTIYGDFETMKEVTI